MAESKRARLKLQNVRLSFPSLYETELYDGDDTGKYAATFLIEKSDKKQIKMLKDRMLQVAKEKWGDKVPKTVQYCLLDGDDKELEGYAGCVSVKGATKKTVAVYDRDRSVLHQKQGEDKLYAGCYVNASIDFWAMDNKWGKKVLCNLFAVQFVKDGEPFGSGPVDTEDDFDDLTDGEEADDDDDIPFDGSSSDDDDDDDPFGV